MTNFSFNLLDSPWIPLIGKDGCPTKGSIEDCLFRPHDYREIDDQSPLVVVSIHRVLLAILHRVFGPKDKAAWIKIYNENKWNEKDLKAYFKKWHSRFDLFDKEHPFFQDVSLTATPKEYCKVSRLDISKASGQNGTLFDHTSYKKPFVLQPDRAACLLVAIQATSICGGKSKPFNLRDAALTGSATFVALGKDLFETLMLNLVPYNKDEPIPSNDEDKPAWELSSSPVPEKSATPKGYLDVLTSQSRRVKLLPELVNGEIQISHCILLQGVALDKQNLQDPMKQYSKFKDAWKALRFAEDVALWRNSTVLLRSTFDGSRSSMKPPAQLDFVCKLILDGILPKEKKFCLSALGVSNKQGKIFFWRSERLPIHVDYLTNEDRLEKLEEAIIHATEVADALKSSVYEFFRWNLCQKEKPGKHDKKRIRDHMESRRPTRTYWSLLESSFYRLLEDILVDREKALKNWKDATKKAVFVEFNQLAPVSTQNANMMKATVMARSLFGRRTAKLFKEQENGDGVRKELCEVSA
jgi:CRISPR system Cascade subunit CasA